MPNLFDQFEQPPDFRLTFRVVPSWNDFLASASNPYMQGTNIKLWRGRGRERTAEAFKEMGLPVIMIRRELRSTDKKTGLPKQEFFEGLESPFFDEPVACLVRLWRPTAAAYDVHNLVIKPILDGAADVRLIAKDSADAFPQLGFRFEGVDPTLKLTQAERDERKQYLDKWRDKGKNPPRLPLPARIWLDFNRLSVLPNGSIYSI